MKNFFLSFVYAFKGIRIALRQRNFRIQLAIALIVITTGLYVGLTTTEWTVIFLTIGLVLTIETVNTSIENLVNLVMPEYHPLAGKVKDLSAGAALIVSIIAAIIGIIIFSKHV